MDFSSALRAQEAAPQRRTLQRFRALQAGTAPQGCAPAPGAAVKAAAAVDSSRSQPACGAEQQPASAVTAGTRAAALGASGSSPGQHAQAAEAAAPGQAGGHVPQAAPMSGAPLHTRQHRGADLAALQGLAREGCGSPPVPRVCAPRVRPDALGPRATIADVQRAAADAARLVAALEGKVRSLAKDD